MTRCLAQSVHLGCLHPCSSFLFMSVYFVYLCSFVFSSCLQNCARHIPISEVGQICTGYSCCAHGRLQLNARPDSGILGKFWGLYWLLFRCRKTAMYANSCVDILALLVAASALLQTRQCQHRRHFFISSDGERWLCRRHPKRGRCGDYGLNMVESCWIWFPDISGKWRQHDLFVPMPLVFWYT